MDALAIAKEEASKLAVELDDATLEYLIWEHTGWPGFFMGDPEQTFREQLRMAMGPVAKVQEAKRRQDLQDELPTQWELILLDQ